MLNIFTSLFSKSPGVAKHTPAKKVSFTIAGKTIYYLTSDPERFEYMQTFFKQFDLMNNQTWESTEQEMKSFMTLRATWKYAPTEDQMFPYVGSMAEETIAWYKKFLLAHKTDFYVVDQNLGSVITTGQNIIQCISYAQNVLHIKEKRYPLAVYLYSEGDEIHWLHKALRYVMVPEHGPIHSITPQLYATLCDLIRSIEKPTLTQKI